MFDGFRSGSKIRGKEDRLWDREAVSACRFIRRRWPYRTFPEGFDTDQFEEAGLRDIK